MHTCSRLIALCLCLVFVIDDPLVPSQRLSFQWRYTSTFPPTIGRWDYTSWKLYWWWLFFSAEFFLAIAVWVGLAQRLFPVQRIKVTMDDITSVDDQVGYNAR